MIVLNFSDHNQTVCCYNWLPIHRVSLKVVISTLFMCHKVLSYETVVDTEAFMLLNLLDRLREKGILLSADGPNVNVLKIKPPLVITKEDVDHFMDTFVEILHDVGH